MKSSTITIGILAHVDAGKTTLAERILYLTGTVRRLGRVDHQDAFLDTHALEKERGITIFSKQANFALDNKQITLLDTPGHVDFSAEMERTLQVLDYAILLISAPDGVTGHVMTLWRLLKTYRIPVFVFVNKMDQPGTDAGRVLRELKDRFGDGFAAWQSGPAGDETGDVYEEMATSDESALEEYLESGVLSRETVRRLIAERKVFPCFFGSALKGDGTEDFLNTIVSFMQPPELGDAFAARVFKISREGGMRLTWVRIMGGTLKVKEMAADTEKVDQIRIYNGAAFTLADQALAGQVCALTGPVSTFAGQGLGTLRDQILPVLESVISYSVLLPEGADPHAAFIRLKQLEEEMPELHVSADKDHLMVRVMGEVQVQILKRLLPERFGLDADFGEGRIVYRETIARPMIGSGHYEPLRHYAEVHLLMEPGERGSGIVFESACPLDRLDLNWQRLIGTHVLERAHAGVLTGSELTDVHITLLAGRAHLKHTEGGDFREATYRAIRQGLMKAGCRLLEPVYLFRIELPVSASGRAMADIQNMHGHFEGPEVTEDGQTAVLTGSAPVSAMMGYDQELRGYTHGMGRMNLLFGGYQPCADEQKVAEEIGYDAEADTANPSGSVFCSHGAGLFVPWYEADSYMHITPEADQDLPEPDEEQFGETPIRHSAGGAGQNAPAVSDEELAAIFERTYGDAGRGRNKWKKTRSFDLPVRSGRPGRKPAKEALLLVDGYNIMNAWPRLKELSAENLDAARTRLMDILANYRGYRQMILILVFDAYKVPGGEGSVTDHHGIHVVYTKEAETADAYIEKAVHRLAREFDVTVATSDNTEQMIIWGEGARRMPARELREEIEAACAEIERDYLGKKNGDKRYMFEELPDELKGLLESMRLGKDV